MNDHTIEGINAEFEELMCALEAIQMATAAMPPRAKQAIQWLVIQARDHAGHAQETTLEALVPARPEKRK